MFGGINNAFLQLKPVCDHIATNPTPANIAELNKILNSHDKTIIQRLHEYIIFPLYIQLENNTNNSIKQQLLDTLKNLLTIVKIEKLKIIFQLSLAITKQIFDITKTELLPHADEELKLSAVKCLTNLFHNLPLDVLCEIHTRKYSVQFSQSIYLCLQIAKMEKMRELRLNAIKCLMTISYVHNSADFYDTVLRKQVADTTMFYLPGIAIALRNIALDDDKQGHKITSLALIALHRIIVLHLQDDKEEMPDKIIIQFPLEENNPVDVEYKKKDVETMKKRLETDTRDKEWCRNTSEKLNKIIESLMPLQSYYHERVRLELAEFCHAIICNCSKNLQKSLTHCIEILIVLSEDDNTEVAEKSKLVLTKISNTNLNVSLLEILYENFYNVITGLPRIINDSDSQKQISGINLLVGYLRLLGTNYLSKILQSPVHLKRLIQSLIIVSQLEKASITVLEDYTVRDFEFVQNTKTKWKQFKFLDDKLLFSKFQIALHLLAKSDTPEILIDHLCELFLDEPEQRNEIVFILNEILSVKQEDKENHLRIISNVLNMYIDTDNWYLSTDPNDLTLTEIHNNIIQMSLLVEGLGYMAMGIGTDFKTFLLKTLYIVLERAGSAQPTLSAAGLSALIKISTACEYPNVTTLIVENTDYFSFHVIKRLKRLNEDMNVLNVLNVVMKYSKIDVLPSVMDIIDGVLFNSFDKFQEHNITGFLIVFYSFVENLKRWMNINAKSTDKTVDLLKDYKKNMEVYYGLYCVNYDDEVGDKTAEETYEDMKRAEEEYCVQEEEDTRKPEIPEHIKLTVQVLKRSLHFLPSRNRERKLLVLNILKEGIEIISKWEDELLPIVHQIWSPLSYRFKSHEDPLEINKSFDLLCVLAKLSKDFIRSRTSKTVLPEICKMINTLSKLSYLKDRGSAYRYTQEYKLQLIIINQLALLITNLELSPDDIKNVLDSIQPYLSNKQPLPLQESVINFFKTLACYDFETVWGKLIEFWANIDQEHRKNTEIVLKSLEILHW